MPLFPPVSPKLQPRHLHADSLRLHFGFSNHLDRARETREKWNSRNGSLCKETRFRSELDHYEWSQAVSQLPAFKLRKKRETPSCCGILSGRQLCWNRDPRKLCHQSVNDSSKIRLNREGSKANLASTCSFPLHRAVSIATPSQTFLGHAAFGKVS